LTGEPTSTALMSKQARESLFSDEDRWKLYLITITAMLAEHRALIWYLSILKKLSSNPHVVQKWIERFSGYAVQVDVDSQEIAVSARPTVWSRTLRQGMLCLISALVLWKICEANSASRIPVLSQ
jgi:hypothetical protein